MLEIEDKKEVIYISYQKKPTDNVHMYRLEIIIHYIDILPTIELLKCVRTVNHAPELCKLFPLVQSTT